MGWGGAASGLRARARARGALEGALGALRGSRDAPPAPRTPSAPPDLGKAGSEGG